MRAENIRTFGFSLMLVAALGLFACGGGGDTPATGTTSNVPNRPEPEPEKKQDTKSSAAIDSADAPIADSSSDVRSKVAQAFKDMICLTQKGDAKAAKKVYKKHGFKNRKDFDKKWSHYAKTNKKWANKLAAEATAKGACK